MTTFLNAALNVMSAERPLTTREITERIVGGGLVTTRGRTPARTLSAELYREEKRPEARVRRLFTPGKGRAVPGSVRWVRTRCICDGES
jgi:HB1, ASXL, restriction endonuclease HTH domain